MLDYLVKKNTIYDSSSKCSVLIYFYKICNNSYLLFYNTDSIQKN